MSRWLGACSVDKAHEMPASYFLLSRMFPPLEKIYFSGFN